MVWSGYEGSLLYRALFKVNTALLPIEVRGMIRLYPLVLLHILRHHVDVVSGGAGRFGINTSLKDTSF